MKKLGFVELSNVFADQAKLPYSTACVWSYCRQNRLISDNITFNVSDWHYVLDKNTDPIAIANSLSSCDIVGISYFVWNSRISDLICAELKKLNPKIVIVYGGLGVPRPSDISTFLNERPYIDYVVHNEGELSFEKLLLFILGFIPEYELRGVSTATKIYAPIQRVKNISDMPSPYLDGLFDELIALGSSYSFEGIIEPERGCPYSCTFCEVGDSYFTKISKHSIDKILTEIDWLAKNKITYLHIVDNNFGMYKDHLNIAEYLVEINKLTGYPTALNLTWAKNKRNHLYDIAEVLQKAKLNKGVTIALQSLNLKTLNAIKRSDLDNNNLKEILLELRTRRIPAFIELILGLPEETLTTFKDGIYYLLDDIGYTEYMTINNMIVLPSSPFSVKEYMDQYGIGISNTAPLFAHHEQPVHKLLIEDNLVVTSTSTMSFEDYKEANLWKWFMLSTHFLGWTRIISKRLKEQGISYKEFYEGLYKYIKEVPCLLHSEYDITESYFIEFINKKKPWGRQVLSISNLYWEYEEATAISIVRNKDLFYSEIKNYVSTFHNIQNIDTIIDEQSKKMKDPYTVYNGDIELWCKDCMWWGRRVERFFVGEYFDVL